mgnify:CR=1 FL=1
MPFMIATGCWLIAAYGALAVVGWHNGIDILPANAGLGELLFDWSPWVLTITSPVFWFKFRKFRAMRAAKALHLPRSISEAIEPARVSRRPGLWERVSAAFLALGLAALVYRLGLPEPGILFIAGCIAWLFVKLSIRMLATSRN